MKLRFPFRFQQLLSAAGCAALLGSAAMAQDLIFTNDGQPPKQVKVVGMSPSGQTLEFLVGEGKLGLPIASIKEVRMAPPAELAHVMQSYEAKDYAKALALLKPVTDRFKGMPSPWAQQATSMLGDIFVAMNELQKAEAAYADFKRLYPSGGSMQSEVGLARIAVAKKDYATAKQKLAPITEAALKEKTISPANALAFSNAFVVSGQLKEAEGNLSGALEDYLRTVTLFYHDRAAVALAQDKADTLRSRHKEVTVP
jgi:tetratricopeptide (TPR) repeat protein